MIVSFLRHGPALPSGTPGVTEQDRPLSPDGRRRTMRAARGILRLDLGIDAVFTSPLARAQETAEILAGTLRLDRPQVSDKLLPDVPGRDLLGILRDTGAEAPVLVGHEPSLALAVAFLIGAGENQALELKKSGLAVVRLRKLAPSPEATLRLLLTPSALRALGR